MNNNDRQIVLETLNKLGINYSSIEHPPIPTIEDALVYWKDLDAVHCKNLFFRNHKGNKHYMVVFEHSKKLAIKDLEQKLKQGKLSFASEKRMIKYLKTIGGSISPFGLINDTENHTFLFLDKNLLEAENISFHPNDNTMTIVVSISDFKKYIDWVGNEYEFLEL
ncbi:MAG: prolyl-tRNA editing protein [Bacteroidetes bacterium 4572_112]|nr:MAG: prolyl-tRNA editing protein [Bacteroidetes bacterium 4572_112]